MAFATRLVAILYTRMMSGFYNSVLFLFLLFTDSPLLLRDALGNGMGGTAWGFGVQFFV
jgi:hypothetical protein